MAAAAAADDLLFLLSLVRNPGGVVAEKSPSRDGGRRAKKSSRDGDATASWQQTVASLPVRRKQIVVGLQRLAGAFSKWRDLHAPSGAARESNSGPQNDSDADALEEVEEAASSLREGTSQYVEAIEGYSRALRQFWLIGQPHSDLAHVGRTLASQLMRQLKWDEGLGRTVLAFLDDDLYNNINGKGFSAAERLRVWSDAISKMMKINTSYWEFVEREAYDETELEQGKESPELLNGEPSTHDVSFVNVRDEGAHVLAIEGESVYERFASSTSVEEAVDAFLQSDSGHVEIGESSISSILLVGEEGCGKTYLLDSLQRRIAKANADTCPVKVLRPKYPVDLVGNSVGSSEDRLISLFNYASRTASYGGAGKCLIMLDDIDRMFSLSNDANIESPGADAGVSTTQHFIGRRCKALFLSILDALREHKSVDNGRVLLLCTSRSRCAEVADRFDRIFKRGQPDAEHRRKLIKNSLSFGSDLREGEAADTESLLSLVAHHSAGRSALELAQCCREAILRCAEPANTRGSNDSMFMKRLQCLDKMLQTKSPQSLRGGSLDGVVDMRVYTPEELKSRLTIDANGEVKLPLLGAEAKRAHEALMNVLVTPLCRSDEIRALLYGGSGTDDTASAKPIRVGALLAGAPGVGKTSLAYHCASLAAKMSRVSLLDVSCTSLIHKEIGGSERAVQRLFAAVRAAAPCVLLLDGIECVAPKRGNDTTSEGTMDRVLSTFLTEMDGIETGGATGNVAVIGVTHNPKLIDPSLLRPGRLEKTITLGAPDFEARKEQVARQIRDIHFDFALAGYFDPKSKDDVAQSVAMESAGMSAVEVIAICREASMECLRALNFDVSEKPTMTYDHFKSAIKIMKGKAAQ
ncbi:hypothetical protein ACHAXT_012107 [Thalassiosira profunda]